MTRDEAASLMAIALFGIGAVAVILYQHAQATNQVLATLGASPAAGASAAATTAAALGIPASSAGTPTVGQDGSAPVPAVELLSIGAGYLLN